MFNRLAFWSQNSDFKSLECLKYKKLQTFLSFLRISLGEWAYSAPRPLAYFLRAPQKQPIDYIILIWRPVISLMNLFREILFISSLFLFQWSRKNISDKIVLVGINYQ